MVDTLRQGNNKIRYTPGTIFTQEDLFRYINDELNSIAQNLWQLSEGRHEDTWDDLRFPFTQTKLGALLKPDFDETNVGLLFPQDNPNEISFMIGQLPHGYRPGTPLRPHIHWQQSSALFPTWTLEYKWFNEEDLVPAAFTSLSVSTGKVPYVSGNMAQISKFDEIDGTDKIESSILLMKFFRDDDVVSGDVLAFEFDMHYISGKTGSVVEDPS